MSRITEAIDQSKDNKRSVFVAYVTAGDPNLEETGRIVKTIADNGADIIELGVPFSDPMADGPTNQLAAERALANGVGLRDIIGLVKNIRNDGVQVPIVLFTYLNPVFKMGFTTFASEAQEAGIDGALVVDLPPQEIDSYQEAMKQHGLDTIFLASPTTDAERLKFISSQSSGFVYYVSRTGVTGARTDVSDSLGGELDVVRQNVGLPVMVGFGISTPEQAKQVAQSSDGIVIGSALVKIIEGAKGNDELHQSLSTFVSSIRQALS